MTVEMNSWSVKCEVEPTGQMFVYEKGFFYCALSDAWVVNLNAFNLSATDHAQPAQPCI